MYKEEQTLNQQVKKRKRKYTTWDNAFTLCSCLWTNQNCDCKFARFAVCRKQAHDEHSTRETMLLGLVNMGKPWMLQCLFCCRPPLGVDVKQVFDKVYEHSISDLQVLLQWWLLWNYVLQLISLLNISSLNIRWEQLKWNLKGGFNFANERKEIFFFYNWF